MLFALFALTRAMGKKTARASELRRIEMTNDIYAQDSDEQSIIGPPQKSPHPELCRALSPYVKKRRMFHCPSAAASEPHRLCQSH